MKSHNYHKIVFKRFGGFRDHIKLFGYRRGAALFYKIKFKKTDNIKLYGIAHPIKLRRDTSDIPTFYQIFFRKEYSIKINFKPETIIDAGANIGLGAIYYTNKYPDAMVISIEPESDNFELLQDNTKDYPNVVPIKKALSNVNEQDLIVSDNGWGNWGFMTETKEKSESQVFKNLVKTISIDAIMEQYKMEFIDILKIDIEGYEKELFESNIDNWLPKTRLLIIELHDNMKAGCSKSFFKAISSYNFSFSYRGENLVFRNNDL